MKEKVESGLEVEVFEARTDDEDGCSMGPVVLKMDYDRAMAEKDAEIQRQRERHRATWTQLEQVKGLLRDVYAYAPISEKFRIDAALSQQAEPKCCTPTEEELQLLNNGEYTPEELWGGREPSCPDCAKPAPAQDEQQPYMWVRVENNYIEDYTQDANLAEIWMTEDWPVTMPLYAAPIAQTALSAVTAERDRLREELAATNRGINAKLPGRKFAAVGTGALYAEQNYCYRRGWKEGVAALRAQIRAAAVAAKEA